MPDNSSPRRKALIEEAYKYERTNNFYTWTAVRAADFVMEMYPEPPLEQGEVVGTEMAFEQSKVKLTKGRPK